jgi:urease accessory protein
MLDVTDSLFAANRAFGRLALSAKVSAGATRRGCVREEGSLRVRCPGPPAAELEAVVVNTSGGMAGGDRFEIEVTVEPGARLLVTSAAAEKVYRAENAETSVTAKFHIAAGGELAWLPQETILFDRARLRRSIDIDLAPGARLLLAEAIVLGRSGMGEIVSDGFLLDRRRIRQDGRLLHAETVRLEGAIAEKLAESGAARGGNAVASVLVIPGDEAVVAAMRATSAQPAGEIGASAWNGLAVARLVSADGAALRHDLVGVLAAVRSALLPRLWLH